MADDHEVGAPLPIDPLPGIFNAGFLSLLSGASGIGKTALIADLARRFRDGDTIAGHQSHAVPVGYITADRPWDDSRLWFNAVGFPEIRQYSILDDHGFNLDLLGKRGDGPKALASCLDQLQMPGPGIIFVDPIALFLGGNLLDYNTVALGCIKLHRQISRRVHIPHCLVGVCHTAKQKADAKDRYMRPQDRINGSGALLGFTATQITLMSPEEYGKGSIYHLFLNPHHRRPETWYLEKSNETGLFRYVGAPVTSPTEQLNDKLLSLHAILADPPIPNSVPSIMRQLSDVGVTPKTVTRWLHSLEEAGFVIHQGRNSWVKVVQESSAPPA